MTTPEVVPVTRSDVERLGAVIATAFDDDPLFTWAVPDRERRNRRLPAWAAASVRTGLAHGVADTAGGGSIALWYAPGRTPRMVDQLRGGALGALLRLRPGDVRRLASAERQAETAHRRHDPGSAAWYLAFLAVAPEDQGKGYAGALLRHGLARADRTGAPVWLETNTARNVAMYERFGFEVVAHEPAGALPEFWGLLRQGRGAEEPLHDD
ncbi:GNAT family N-acetyltransferase [Georgenia sp. Z1344]|uniref:GNAT family N-acetyltransferase n=1 Tax=Georgenia sp. Z1344 TaxID=3416706 RepID=UPI003CE75C55